MKKAELITVWRIDRPCFKEIQFHSHNYYELVYYVKGSGTTNVADRQYSFKYNSFMIIPPNAEHSEKFLSDGDVICLGVISQTKLPLGLFFDRSLTIFGILQEILSEATQQHYGYNEIINAKLCELFIKIFRFQNQNATNTKNFDYIIRYISENYHEKIVLSSCAEQLNLSYDYFQHKFKQLTGYSPQAFLVKQRLTAAKQILEQQNLSCTEIAFRCGFSTSAQFSMMFKKEFGISPQEYKKTLSS